MKKTVNIVLIALLSSPLPSNPVNAQDVTGGGTSKVARAVTRFGFHLFSKLVKNDERKNVFISPTSISLALAMTCNGAEGSTQLAMSRTLGMDSLDIPEVNDSYDSLLSFLSHPDSLVQLQIANSIWANKDFIFKSDFIDKSNTHYRAEVQNLDYADPSSPPAINSWVSQKTHGKITKIVDRIEPDALLILLNAIYFKGVWSDKFDGKNTRDKDFHLPGGGEKKVRMMRRAGQYQYLRGYKFQAISLPYGTGRMSLDVVLPDSGVLPEEFYGKILNKQNWEELLSQLQLMQGTIELPRFKLENDFRLNDPLISLGMGEAFDPSRADFRGMCYVNGDQIVYISEVLHKTYVEVNEEGSEAAAVTKVEMAQTAGLQPSPPPPFRMIVNRPFFVAIRDNTTGLLLFIGSIVDP